MFPSMFIAHGSPMVAIEQSEYGAFLDGLGPVLGKPSAIVLFSAHWESPVQMVSQIDTYGTMYDFGGFPDELYRIQYPAKGDNALSRRIQTLLTDAGIAFQVETARPLDHGAWTILHRMFPQADVPLVTMSVNPDSTPAEQFGIGQALASLRADNVLIIGSGVTVHNFGLIRVKDKPEYQAAVREFEHWLEDAVRTWNLPALFDYEAQAPHAHLAVPPNGREHFVPLFYVMGAAGEHPTANVLHRSWLFDIMANTVLEFR